MKSYFLQLSIGMVTVSMQHPSCKDVSLTEDVCPNDLVLTSYFYGPGGTATTWNSRCFDICNVSALVRKSGELIFTVRTSKIIHWARAGSVLSELPLLLIRTVWFDCHRYEWLVTYVLRNIAKTDAI